MLLLVIALSTLSTASDSAAEPCVIGVRIDESARLGRPPELREELAVTALALRLRRAQVGVCAASDSVYPPWHVEITAPEAGRLAVHLGDTSGESLLELTMPVGQRRGEELAHTIALLVVEALSPMMPQFADELAAERQAPTATALTTDVAPVTDPGPADRPMRWRMHGGATARWLLPQDLSVVGALMGASAHFDPWLAALDLTYFGPLVRRGADYRVRAHSGSGRVLAGMEVGYGRTHLELGAGAEARALRITAAGDGVLFRERWLASYGVAAAGRVLVALGLADVSMHVAATRYLNRHPRVVVDGVRVLNLGHTALEAGLAVGRSF